LASKNRHKAGIASLPWPILNKIAYMAIGKLLCP